MHLTTSTFAKVLAGLLDNLQLDQVYKPKELAGVHRNRREIGKTLRKKQGSGHPDNRHHVRDQNLKQERLE